VDSPMSLQYLLMIASDLTSFVCISVIFYWSNIRLTCQNSIGISNHWFPSTLCISSVFHCKDAFVQMGLRTVRLVTSEAVSVILL
jgi:F0F1-type ATP synthase assembly protein I